MDDRLPPPMCAVPRLSVVDQTCLHLKEGIRTGRWKGRLPGIRPLKGELGVSQVTLVRALRRLETEGVIAVDEGGLGRTILTRSVGDDTVRRHLRVSVLLMQPEEELGAEKRTLLRTILEQMKEDGHTCSLLSLPSGTDPGKTGRLAALVKAAPSDAWIVYRGSLEVLRWFAERPVPILAIAGNSRRLDIASVGHDGASAIREATRRLVELGHTRIVYVAPRAEGRDAKREPHAIVKVFLEELAASGTSVGEYNWPDWEESPVGMRRLMESLFRFTPPTALIFWNAHHLAGALPFLHERGVRIPRDLSLICHDTDPLLNWQMGGAEVAHLEPESEDQLVRRVRQWVAEVAAGEPARGHRVLEVKFLPGDTLAPAPKSSVK